MTDVRIGTLRRRYRLPADAVSERARIDGVFNAALANDLFDAALERAGMSASDEVCIRRVTSVVRLSASADDAKLAVLCSVALADAIVSELASGGSNVVRFGSRRQALIDMAVSVARGNLERAWAWRRLDLWHGDAFDSLRGAERAVFAALARSAADAPHVLVAVADAGVLATYIVHVSAMLWSALAQSVLAESQAPWPFADAAAKHNGSQGDGAQCAVAQRDDQMHADEPATDDSELLRWLEVVATRIRRTSRLLRSVLTTGNRVSPTLARALAALALVECEPALAASTHCGELVRSIAEDLDHDQSTQPGVAPKPQPARSTESDEPADTRVHLSTQFGGLLFLLHAVRALDLPGEVATHSVLRTRSFSWVLHELAALLLQQAFGDACNPEALRDDAAAFVFAGIIAGTARDGTFRNSEAARALASEPAVTAAEFHALRPIVADVVAWLRERGGALREETDTALLSRIIQRSAEIVADAAWIEARFSVNDTSTNIRRVGLDLDLGWLPWLGMVVRFVYA